MVSVIQVYNALKDLMNKEQKGFITPAVFNSFAPIAQINVYNEIFSELITSKRLSRQNFDPGGSVSQRKQKLEDLSFFVRRKTVDISEFDDDEAISISGLSPDSFQKPDDLSKIISISAVATTEDNVLSDINPCEIVYNPADLDNLLVSNLSSPTDMFPVAFVSNTTIELFPEDASGQIEITYYAKPTSFNSSGAIESGQPNIDVILVEGLEIFSATSKNFMLPAHYLNEVVVEMAKLVGIRLRDPNVTVFATREEASE